jgi:putative tryptophan/tyrosine transport system substrate-binding protein
MISRRRFLGSLGVGVLVGPFEGAAQPAAKIPRIGYISAEAVSADQAAAFREGLRELGYIEGRNIIIEYRFARGRYELLPGFAAELVRQKVDLIVANNTPAVRAAKEATTTIPIVMPSPADAVGSGLVASLAHPGGNVTGLSFLGSELVGKRLQLLKEVVPTISVAAVLWHPDVFGEGTVKHMREETEVAARALGLDLQWVPTRKPDDFPGAFASIARTVRGLLVWPSPMFQSERLRLVDLAAQHRLLAVYYLREYVEAGGLLSYGPNLANLHRRAATYVDKILKGAKPADLPIEQPTKFELVINLKTAKALGLTIPPSLLLRADEVIQ